MSMTALRSSIGRDSQEGFTLLEILVSLAVMAIVLVSLFRLHSSTLKLADAARSKSLLPFIARQQLAEILSQPPDEGRVSGEVEEDGTLFHWSCTVSEAPLDGPIALSEDQAKRFRVFKLKITPKGEGPTFTLTTWRYQGELDK